MFFLNSQKKNDTGSRPDSKPKPRPRQYVMHLKNAAHRSNAKGVVYECIQYFYHTCGSCGASTSAD